MKRLLFVLFKQHVCQSFYNRVSEKAIINVVFSTLMCRDEKQQLLLGIRRANRQPTNISSSVLSSDSMHIGILAAAAHAAANHSPFTVFYNPRYVPTHFFWILAFTSSIRVFVKFDKKVIFP